MLRERQRLVISLPALLGSSLVLVYLFGIFNAAGSFSKAGVPQSAIRFLSVEQLLVRGISILAQPSVMANIAGTGIAIGVLERLTKSAGAPLSPASRTRVIKRGIRLGLIYLVVIGGVCLFKPWEVGLSIAPFAVLPLVMIWVSKQGKVPHSMMRQLNVLFASVALTSLLLGSYLLPLPQPRAAVRCLNVRPQLDSCPVGVLITHTDEVWYLWKEANEEVAVIPDTALAEVNLTYPASKAGKTPATLLVRHVLGAI